MQVKPKLLQKDVLLKCKTMKEEITDTFKREVSKKTSYFEECYNTLIEKFNNCNYREFEEFLEYAKEMAKITSKPSSSFNAIRGVEYKPFYED